MADLQIGFEVVEDVILGNDNTNRSFSAQADDANQAQAIGIENGDQGTVSDAFTIDLGGGRDTIEGEATATAETGEAFADGVRNQDLFRLGARQDTLRGIGTATTGANGEITFATGINSTDRGQLRGQAGTDLFEGIATANGQDNVGAFGVLVTDLRTNNGRDTVSGTATAQGLATTDARGVSVGFSDIDDDTTAGNPPGLAPTTSGVDEVGQLLGGNGDNTIEGTAEVTVAGQNGDEIFFAGANGIVVDGGRIDQLKALVDQKTFDELVGIQNGEITDEAIIQEVEEAILGVLPQLETSTMDLGAGNDALIANVSLNASQVGEGADDDLEVIGDGIENAGDLLLGTGDDSVNSTVDVITTIRGAKGLADAMDNSSVGIITGLLQEVDDQILFSMGAGEDTFTSDIFAAAVDDLAAADGLGNRGVFEAGDGSDVFNLTAESVFVRVGDVPADPKVQQEEGIADGWENRNRVFLDDAPINPLTGEIDFVDGVVDPAGDGNDRVTTSATTQGNGILTIAEGLETREFFDAGGGNDVFDLTASATSEGGILLVDRDGNPILDVGGNQVVGGILDPNNLTQAAGLQTEQISSGDFFLGTGDDEVVGLATATALDENRATLAFGITQVTGDAINENDAGLFHAGEGNNVLDGTATASGVVNSQVDAHGILFTNAVAGAGDDQLIGVATATGGNLATGNGIRVGVLEDNPIAPNGGELLLTEAGAFDAGAGLNTLTGEGTANLTSDGANVTFADANGILVDKDSTLTTGDDVDTITGRATAIDNGVGGGNFLTLNALSADGVEVRGDLSTGGGADIITGDGFISATNSFVVSEGIDFGLGSTQNGIAVTPIVNTGAGDDQLIGTGEAIAVGLDAAAITAGIQTQGVLDTGAGDDLIEADSTSTVVGGANGIRGAIADGFENRDRVFTGAGDDTIRVNQAVAIASDFNASANGVRNGIVDGVSGDAAGLINMGNGDDSIFVVAAASSINGNATANGIGQEELGSEINLGRGNDVIAAEANAVSIFGDVDAFGLSGGVINAGAGRDLIEARSNDELIGDFNISLRGGQGFGNDVAINMGGSRDTLLGFGQAKADGGRGVDTLQFEFSLMEFIVGGGSIDFFNVDFTFAGVTLETDNFEFFQFNVNPSELNASTVQPNIGLEPVGPLSLDQLQVEVANIESQMII